jgi:chromosomal replication initiation ATPase DnaA
MNQTYTLENFYTHKGNEVAYLAAKKIIELPGEVFNPFYIYGAKELGKTHLLNAINSGLAKKGKTLFLSVGEFEKQMDDEVVFDSPLIIDDIHKLRDVYKDRLLQIIERAVEENIQVCLSADVAPQDIGGFSATLCALIESGLICNLQPAMHEDRAALIKKKAEDAGIILPDDLTETLAQVGTGSIKTIVNVINRLVAFTSLGNIPNDEETLRTILADFYPKTKVCHVRSVLATLKSDDMWRLASTERSGLKREYEQKMHAWRAKGFNIDLLKDAMSVEGVNLGKAYNDFLKKVCKLIEMQKAFYNRAPDGDRVKAMQIESMVFNPAKANEIERLLEFAQERKEDANEFRTFSSYLLGACNREAWSTYHDEVLENLGEHNPCFVFGPRGTGKTHFLEAICADLISREKKVAFFALANEEVTVDIGDMETNDVLVFDDFQTILEDGSRLNSIMTVIEICLQSDKQIFIGSMPIREVMPGRVKSIADKGLAIELDRPSADVALEYIERRAPDKAAAIGAGEIPGFDSFYDIDYYIKSSDREESPVIPLGLPGESIDGGGEVSPAVAETVPHECITAQLLLESGSVDIEDESRYMMPAGPEELIEEKF